MRKRVNIKTLGLIIAAIYIGSVFISQRVNAYKIEQEISRQQSELQKLKEKNQRLQDEVNMSKTEQYMEKLARERLGLVKKGETPVIHSANDKN